MTQPVVHDYLTQIFVKHYKNQPKQAAENAHKFLEIIDLYGMEMIVGDWREQMRPEKDGWELALEEAAVREPWLALEIQS